MTTHQIAAEAAREICDKFGMTYPSVGFLGAEHWKDVAAIIEAAIKKATKQAWQEHDDVVDALRVANETIKQLGARNQQLRAAHASEQKEGDASCPTNQSSSTSMVATPQGSNAAPTFKPEGAANRSGK